MAKRPAIHALGLGRPSEGGFTLLEAFVAVALLSLALGGAYRAMSAAGLSTARAERTLEAVALAESTLARVGADIALAAGRRSIDQEGWTISVEIAEHEASFSNVWRRTGARPFDVAVSVTDAGASRASVRLETLRLGPVR